jgi:hypothetical protein
MSAPVEWLTQLRRNRYAHVSNWATGDEAPSTLDLPLLLVHVTTPADQAALHRELAAVGYVPDLLGSNAGGDWWRFYHPDGARPL